MIELYSTVDVPKEAQKRWRDGSFLEHGVPVFHHEHNIPWVPYEDYMEAQLIVATPGKPGLLRIRFNPGVSESKRNHGHPHSDRVVMPIKGSGTFVAIRYGEEIECEVRPGDRLWMPRKDDEGNVIPHNFYAGPILEVYSVHWPFFAFDDPRCLVYPDEQ